MIQLFSYLFNNIFAHLNEYRTISYCSLNANMIPAKILDNFKPILYRDAPNHHLIREFAHFITLIINWKFSRDINEFKMVYIFYLHTIHWFRYPTTKLYYNLNNISLWGHITWYSGGDVVKTPFDNLWPLASGATLSGARWCQPSPIFKTDNIGEYIIIILFSSAGAFIFDFSNLRQRTETEPRKPIGRNPNKYYNGPRPRPTAVRCDKE